MYLCIETNLKKQGMLPLTFSDVADYDKVLPSDRVSLVGLDKLGPGQVSDGTSVLCSVQSHGDVGEVDQGFQKGLRKQTGDLGRISTDKESDS